MTTRWMMRVLREEGLAGAMSVLALAAAVALAVWGHGFTTVDGRARRLAAQVWQAGAADLVIVSSPDTGADAQRGRALFNFRPHAAVAGPVEGVDLSSLPFARVLRVPSGASPPPVLGSPAANTNTPWRLLLNVDYSSIRVVSGSTTHRCRRPHFSGGVACGAQPWHFVGPALRRIDGVQRLCLWAHPPARGAWLVMGFGAQSEVSQQGLRLVFLDEVRNERRPAVEVELRAGDRVLSRSRCRHEQGACLLRPAPAGERQAVELWLRSDDNGRQLLCLDSRVDPSGHEDGA